jgi:hypothetical protein
MKMKKILSIVLSLLVIIGIIFIIPITSNATGFSQRWSAPLSTDKNFINTNYGGYNKCIAIDTKTGFCLPNCTGYAWGRAREILGSSPNLCTTHARDWFGYNTKTKAFPSGTSPKLGAIACWSGGSEGHGHVAVVEAISGNKVTISESGYGWETFYRRDIYNNFYVDNSYKFQGYIYITNTIPTGSKTVSDGEYHIVSALNNSYGVTVAGASKNNQANVQLWNSVTEGNINELFCMKYLSNGNYVITSKNSGKCLDVKNASTASGANVWQYTPNNSKAQQWVVKPTGDGYFYIISALSGMYLDVSGGSVKNGANIQVYNGNSSKAQKWKFFASGKQTGSITKSGDYLIASSINNNFGLNIAGGKTDNGANIHIWNNMKIGNVVNAVVNIKHLGNGIHTITFKKSNKVLDIKGSSNISGANVHQWAYAGNNNQKWIIKSAGNGYYYILGRGSGLALDVYGATAANGTNVQAYLLNNSKAQKWAFYAAPTLNKTSLTIKKGTKYTLVIRGKVGTATFTSSNKTIATVNNNGVVTGKKKGTATITATNRGIKMTCKVTVT